MVSPSLAWRLLQCATAVAAATAGASVPQLQRCSDGVIAAHAELCPENGDHDATKLHLRAGEKGRHGPGWGAGLLEEELDDVDVLVAGGGSAGTSAAIAAARSGARTVLVEGSAVLGGNGGSDKRVTMVGA